VNGDVKGIHAQKVSFCKSIWYYFWHVLFPNSCWENLFFLFHKIPSSYIDVTISSLLLN
jgi:hypothetical protein